MSIWPRPDLLETGSEVVWLSGGLAYSYKEFKDEQMPYLQKHRSSGNIADVSKYKADDAASKHQFLETAFSQAKQLLLDRNFVPWKLHPRGAAFEPDASSSDKAYLRTVEFVELSAGQLQLQPEVYHLELDARGRCQVFVTHVLGAVAALATLAQLFYAHSHAEPGAGADAYCAAAPVLIQDEPRFAHRGLNLDICRNVVMPADVRRTLAALWLAKLNRLHLHASDSQSWPVAVPALPDLAAKGAYHASCIWRPEDVRDVQRYGHQLGIEVFLEIDLPGHTGSVWHAYPELTLAYDKLPWDKWALEPPAGQLKLDSEDVDEFIRTLFGDLCPRVAEYTSLFHVGGDELNTNCYTLEKSIGSSDKAVLRPYLQRFFDNVFAQLSEHGLRPVLWEDILLDYELEFPENAVFQVWRSHESLAKVLARGHKAVFGPADRWYLDVGLGGFLDPDPDNPDTPVKPPFADWNPPYKNWRTIYTYDPFDGVPDEQRDGIVGGEVSLWGELTDSVNLDAMLWPRVGAAAEVLWSGPNHELSEDATRRLAEFRERLVMMGIASHVVQMTWSLQNRGRGIA